MDYPKRYELINNSIKGSKGITLIELIIVLGLLGIILTSILSFFSFNVNVFNNAQKRSDVQHDLLMAADFITRELRTATVVSIYKDIETIPTDPNEGYIQLLHGHLEYGSPGVGVNRTHAIITEIEFSIGENSNLLYFSIVGNEDGQEYTIESEVSLLNFLNTSDTMISGSSVHYLKP